MMQSKISIEIDYEHGNQPILQIIAKDSDDVRDNLIKVFLEKLGNESNWCRLEFVVHRLVSGLTQYRTIHIRPIVPGTDMSIEASFMQAVVDKRTGDK